MRFNSYIFIFVFLPPTIGGFWILVRYASAPAALCWLLLASIVFYLYASPWTLVILAPSILLDYVLAKRLLKVTSENSRSRTALFVMGIAANVAFLGYFKYSNAVLETANAVVGTHFAATPLILPLGISFLVFQKVAFLADVRSGQVKAVPLLDYLLFALFFPRAIAGPIVHFGELAPQFSSINPRNRALHIAVGICLFSIGLFKKAVIADRLAAFVPLAFGDGGAAPPALLESWCGVLAYTLQLYFDFSGYSDMALGVARMCGVRLPMNFNSPFKAKSIVEFWSRWHITLTRFLTAYIYTPIALALARSRAAKGKPILAGKRSRPSAIAFLMGLPTLITMIICGIWHGVGLQFAVWGVLHGIYLTVNQTWRILRPRIFADHQTYERWAQWPGRVLTVGAVVVAMVFFRASSVTEASSILASMAGLHGIFPFYIGLLQRAGERMDWRTEWYLLKETQTLSASTWIAILFFAVIEFPNSLQLLRQFQPALEFPEEGNEQPATLPAGMPRPDLAPTSLHTRIRSAWTGAMTLQREGVLLSRTVALAIAILLVIAVAAVDQGEGFQYGAF
jgi:alginate O-acetyltransferase complex protein AlgI